jgi:hypothetical protein
LFFVADLESGQIQRASQDKDGFFVKTLPDPQSGTDSISSGSGGFGPDSKIDTRVVHSEVVGSETVKPRAGNYFLRSALHYNKSYFGLNSESGQDNPRTGMAMSDPSHRFDYDTEGFLGFSLYVPLNYEHETGSYDRPGAIQLLSIKGPNNANRVLLFLEQSVPRGSKRARWFLGYSKNDSSTSDDGAFTRVDLGPVEGDIGKWTDFVIRFRENPFSVQTNPAQKGIANARNQVYEGNKGVLQVWKSEGPTDDEGNRRMELKIDKVNTPIGLVPHATERRVVNFRTYKFGWKKNPTTVKGPIWFGFDEIRLGFVKDGAGYPDVDPSRQSCLENCGAGDASPKPPNSLSVE